jgi:hypothetical protein
MQLWYLFIKLLDPLNQRPLDPLLVKRLGLRLIKSLYSPIDFEMFSGRRDRGPHVLVDRQGNNRGWHSRDMQC